MEQESYSLRQSLCVVLFSSTSLCAMELGSLPNQEQERSLFAEKSQLVDAAKNLSPCAYALYDKLFKNRSADVQEVLCSIPDFMRDVSGVIEEAQKIGHREHLERWQRLGYREELADYAAYIKEISEHMSPAVSCADEMHMFMFLLEKYRTACWFQTMKDKVEPWLDGIIPYFDNAKACKIQKMVLSPERVRPPDHDSFQEKITCVVSQKMNRFIFSLVFEMFERDAVIPSLTVTPATLRT